MSDAFYLGASFVVTRKGVLNCRVSGNSEHAQIAIELIHATIQETIAKLEKDSHNSECEACLDCLDLLREAFGVLDRHREERMQGLAMLLLDGQSPEECH